MLELLIIAKDSFDAFDIETSGINAFIHLVQIAASLPIKIDLLPLKDIVDTFPDKLLFFPISLVSLLFAFYLFGKRKSIPEDKPWYGIYKEDSVWIRIGIIICWIAFVIGTIPTIWTSLHILLRVFLILLILVLWIIQVVFCILFLWYVVLMGGSSLVLWAMPAAVQEIRNKKLRYVLGYPFIAICYILLISLCVWKWDAISNFFTNYSEKILTDIILEPWTFRIFDFSNLV